MYIPFEFNPNFPDATDEQKLEQVRLWRNDELILTDWTILPDSPLSETDKTSWTTYRQELRDLPATIDISNPNIPSRPGE